MHYIVVDPVARVTVFSQFSRVKLALTSQKVGWLVVPFSH